MTYKTRPSHLRNRDGIYHFIRRIPADLQSHYRSDRICLSLRTKSAPAAFRAAGSISQRLDDYWSGLRLQKMDDPAIHLLIGNNDDAKHDSPTLKEAVEAYLLLKGGVSASLGAVSCKSTGTFCTSVCAPVASNPAVATPHLNNKTGRHSYNSGGVTHSQPLRWPYFVASF